jgi:hypothetical protein
MRFVTRRAASWLWFAIAASVSACGKSAAETTTLEPPTRAAGTASVEPKAPAVVPDGPSGPSSNWRGSYSSAAGTLYVPAQWKGVRWTGADVDAGLGPGTMSLSIETNSGRVRGAIEGPLGPAKIDGYTAGGSVTATISRKDPSDHGFAGTLAGTLADGGASGTMSGSLAGASAIRSATFTLAQSGPARVAGTSTEVH